MDIQTISSLVSSIGFPIAAFCWCAYMVSKEREDSRKEIAALQERHTAESAAFTKVITENTAVLQSLKQVIEDKL